MIYLFIVDLPIAMKNHHFKIGKSTISIGNFNFAFCMFTRPGRPHLSRGNCNLGYPLVNVCITMERSTMLLMGKSTISMAIFNSFLYAYQAEYPCYKLVPNPRARALNPRSFPVGHRQFWLNLGW